MVRVELLEADGKNANAIWLGVLAEVFKNNDDPDSRQIAIMAWKREKAFTSCLLWGITGK